MFKNRSIQMKIINDKKLSKDNHTVENHYYYPNIKEMRNLTLMVGTLYTLKIVVETTSTIAINKFVK